jgi:hypothetical protein
MRGFRKRRQWRGEITNPTLVSDVVAQPDHVHAHPRQPLGGRAVVAERDLQDLLGQVRLGDEVHQ